MNVFMAKNMCVHATFANMTPLVRWQSEDVQQSNASESKTPDILKSPIIQCPDPYRTLCRLTVIPVSRSSLLKIAKLE